MSCDLIWLLKYKTYIHSSMFSTFYSLGDECPPFSDLVAPPKLISLDTNLCVYEFLCANPHPHHQSYCTTLCVPVTSKLSSIAPNPNKILLTRSLPRVINFKFPLQSHLKYGITQYEELCCLDVSNMETACSFIFLTLPSPSQFASAPQSGNCCRGNLELINLD